jgi:gamma-glutamylputrescine oxidase
VTGMSHPALTQMTPRYAEISPWVEPPQDLCPSLVDDVRADVVVLGAGYTGLSSALSLRAQGIDVVVLEQDFAGSGASGRNAGHLTPTIGKDIPTLQRFYGRERTTRLVRFADAAVEHTEEVIRKHGIECEYRACGNVLGSVHPKHDSRLRKAAEVARDAGAHVRFLDPDAMRARGLPSSFHSGVLEERGGHLHPGRYVMGLRRAAIDAGVRLFERSAATSFESGSPVRVRTDSASVTADSAVIATNAYTPALGWNPRSVAPLRVSLFETEPLSSEQQARLGWPGREGVYTSHEVLESYRPTARQTIVGGSKVVRMGFGNRLPPGHDPDAFRIIETAFRERFPLLRDVRVERFWGGWIALTLDFLPRLYVDGPARNLIAGLGYCGHGVAQATLMGELLAARVQGHEHEWESALQRRHWNWPPEPIRWLLGKGLNGALDALDRRTDRQIRRRAQGR